MKRKWRLRVFFQGRLIIKRALEMRPYTIGRSQENDIVLPSNTVSRFHARLSPTPTGWIYEDLNSKNGSYVRGKRVPKVGIEEATEILVGSPNPQRAFRLYVEPEGAPFADSGQGQGLDWWTTTGFVVSQAFESRGHREVLMGRHPQADIHLDAPVVSRRHARLFLTPQGWALEDLNSKNGTFLNGVRIEHPVLLQKGDLIQIGPYRMVYQGGGRVVILQASQGMRIDGVHLVWRAGGKTILHNIDISILPQEFVALVGGSGAGKSTLMKVLSGYLPPHNGQVLVSGDDLYRNFDIYRQQFGYVPQDDILHTGLTVWEALWYAAKLRLPHDLDDREIAHRINRVIDQVELTGQKHTLISSLSGGQRKRASIAVELLADPPVLFLDEPTSGLDPGLERKMMVMLRKLAGSGKTIILITHATANITQCHRIAFLSQGRMVFFGEPQEALSFFQVQDFASIYEKVTAPTPEQAQRVSESWRRKFENSPYHKEYIRKRLQEIQHLGPHSRARQPKYPSVGHVLEGVLEQSYQLVWLVRRYTRLILRDRVLSAILAFIMPLLALLIRLIAKPSWLRGDSPEEIANFLARELEKGATSAFYNVAANAQALLFMIALAAVLLGLFSSAYEVVKERSIYKRERTVFLGLFPYLFSKMIVLGSIAAVNIVVFLVIINQKVPLPTEGVFLPAPIEMYISLLLAAIAAIALGLFISSIAPNSNTVVYIVLATLFGQILFAGTIFKLPGVAKSLSYLTITRWTIEALGISVDLNRLNDLSQTRFQPGEITETVTFTVEKPDPNWKPFEVIMEKRTLPVCSQPIDYPVIKENEMRTIEEEVQEEVTLTPDPITLKTPMTFVLDYERSITRLLQHWVVLAFFGMFFFGAALLALKRQDVV